jgi:hypothetical protein
MAKRNIVAATREDGMAFLSKAQEFLEAAHDADERGNLTATVGCAVHATIAAADAVASVRLGQRWRGGASRGGRARESRGT